MGVRSVARTIATRARGRLQQKRALTLVRRARSVPEFWDDAHRGNLHLWLSGTEPERIWGNLRVQDRVLAGPQRILNVGVGEGHDTRALAKLGHRVDALDISPTALASVETVTENRFLPSDYDAIPAGEYDLVLHHLVAQHMSNADLERQLTVLVRSLKPEGVIALQFATLLNGSYDAVDDGPEAQKVGGVCRAPEALSLLVDRVGGEILKMELVGEYPEYNSGHCCLHARRRRDSAAVG